MPIFLRLWHAEFIKLRRSPAVRFTITLAAVFIAFDAFFFRYPLLHLKTLSPDNKLILNLLPIKITASAWAGLFQPLLLALLPAMLVQIEHRSKAWKHLHAQPISPFWLYLIKMGTLLVVTAGTLLMVMGGQYMEGWLLGRLNPNLICAFPWKGLFHLMAWMLLGSLPLMALYLWLSHRIDHGAVPVALGLVGLVLSIALSRGEMNPPWQRDFIPWVLPYVCAQRSVQDQAARQEVHMAGQRYRTIEVDDATTRIIKRGLTAEQIPWVFPPPTPISQLLRFSLWAWVIGTACGALERGRRDA